MSSHPFPFLPLVTMGDVSIERYGKIVADLRPYYEIVYIAEDGTGLHYGFSGKFCEKAVFDRLREGTRVRFRTTLRIMRVVEVTILA